MSQYVMVCLECPSGGYIGVDSSSGYPTISLRPMSAKVWDSVEDAKKYRAILKKQDAWAIRKFLGLKLGEVVE